MRNIGKHGDLIMSELKGAAEELAETRPAFCSPAYVAMQRVHNATRLLEAYLREPDPEDRYSGI